MKYLNIFITLLAMTLFLSACGGGQSQAASTVESYLQSLVEGNGDQLATLSCKDWEVQAVTELESSSAVKVTLENLACQVSGQEEETTLVTCSGKIVANYGNEVLEINLADRTYRTIQEGGDWRMCGYR